MVEEIAHRVGNSEVVDDYKQALFFGHNTKGVHINLVVVTAWTKLVKISKNSNEIKFVHGDESWS